MEGAPDDDGEGSPAEEDEDGDDADGMEGADDELDDELDDEDELAEGIDGTELEDCC